MPKKIDEELRAGAVHVVTDHLATRTPYRTGQEPGALHSGWCDAIGRGGCGWRRRGGRVGRLGGGQCRPDVFDADRADLFCLGLRVAGKARAVAGRRVWKG